MVRLGYMIELKNRLFLLCIVSILILTSFSAMRFNAQGQQAGSPQNPYPVWQGWHGSGYYIFVAKNYETEYMNTVCDLNAVNVQLNGNDLGPPYDANQIAACHGGNSQQQQHTPPTVNLQTPSVSGMSVTINGVARPTTTGANITKIDWHWGDNQATTGWFPQNHTYLQNGNYTVIATATDNNGLTGSATTSVTISKQPSPLVTKILSPRAQIVAGATPKHRKCNSRNGNVLNT